MLPLINQYVSSMSKTDLKLINKPWPEEDLEFISKCPCCLSLDCALAYADVQDWSFYCAAGKWNYWRCSQCTSLYLNPRPSELSIGSAYSNYYTHADEQSNSVNTTISKVIRSIKNGYLNKTLSTHYGDAFALPAWLYRSLSGLGLLPRSPLHDISRRVPGKLLDIGCGGGKLLAFAKQLGWEVTGLELDETAVSTARRAGLNVIHGSFTDIDKIDQVFDLIICSHVLEHVHDPKSLVELSISKLSQHGELWLQWPNPLADGLRRFGKHWRGLEAPRHITIPSIRAVERMVCEINPKCTVEDKSAYWSWSQMSMYTSSNAICLGQLPQNSGVTIKSLVKYLISRWKIEQCELCVITIKR
jgi:2-polyprenyl-3-methyl-5-hydroxy-6-metoxy-1,4-benzoquinol methylase